MCWHKTFVFGNSEKTNLARMGSLCWNKGKYNWRGTINKGTECEDNGFGIKFVNVVFIVVDYGSK